MVAGGRTLERSRRGAGPRSAVGRFVALARVLTTSAIRSASPVGTPLYFGLGLGAMTLFGPNALRASEVTRAMLSSPATSLALWSAWVLVTLPVARAVIEVPQTFLLRALPVPRWQFLAVTGAHLAAVEIPWIALWARGDGALSAIAAGAGAAGAHGLLVARSVRAAPIGAAAALLFAICAPALVLDRAAGAPVHLFVRLAAATTAARVGVAAAWTRAPEREGQRRSLRLPRRAAAAIAASYLIGIRRSDLSVIGRALLVVAIGGAAVPLAARGHAIVDPRGMSELSLAIAGGSVAVAASGVGVTVFRAERAGRWLLDAAGIGGAARVASTALATGVCGAALGLVHGAIVTLGARTFGAAAAVDAQAVPGGTAGALAGAALALRLVGLGGVWGAALGVIASWNARASHIEGARDGGRSLARMVLVGGLAITGAALLGEAAIALVVAAGALVSVLSSRDAAALPEPLRAHPSARRAKLTQAGREDLS